MRTTISDDALIPELLSKIEILENSLRDAAIERDHAQIALQALEAFLTRTGGHMNPDDQASLARARTVLVACGRLANQKPATWIDRVCKCEPVTLADGTNATGGGRIVNAACVLHGQHL